MGGGGARVSTVPQNLPSCFHCDGCTISYGVLPVLPDTFTRKDAELQNFINTGTKTQVTHTYYDSVTYSNIPLAQQNLRKRIASITYEEKNDYNIKTYDNAIHYSYDIEGNVATIIIDVPHDTIVKQRYKRLDYYYDLVSGKVNELVYQQDSIDQFMHSYEYDADNRITGVQTSRDSLFWENDASYEYYDHGPLAREVIGRRQVQGLDYAYTLNGWIKGMNSSITNPSYDMGQDGNVHDANNTIARDAFGYTLNYFNGDYRSIASINFEATGLPITSLYNGNIAGTTYSVDNLSPGTVGSIYKYDQLNRYVGDSLFKNPGTNSWTTRTGMNDLKEKVSYDENGNILLYLRHGNTAVGPLAMDSLTYHYTKGRDQLAQVNDAVGATNYTVDIDNETSNRNYQYNGIGELAKDSAGGLDTIIWTIYGKIKEVKKYNGDSIVFFYDPMGNRLEKRYYPHSSTSDTALYARNVQGNIIAVYDRKKDTVRLTEWDIYGSSRIGSLDTLLRMQKPSVGVGTIDSLTINYLEGQKQYELDNHLGNVLVTVSDKKIPVDTVTTDTLVKYYLPLVINAQDYYPFGMVEPGRSYLLSGDSSYRYAFNGKEHVDQIYGVDDAYDYGFRYYDPRLGRFMSVDPLAAKYPFYTPYSFAGNTPIQAIDLDGLEPYSSARGAEELPNHGSTAAVDATAISGYTAEQTQMMMNPPKNDDQQPQQAVISQGGVMATPEYKQFSYNIKLEAKLLLPVDQFKKIANGEKLSAADWAILGISFIPAEKVLGAAAKMVKGVGGELLAEYAAKFSNQLSHLQESDIQGALKDIAGNPVVNDVTGKVYNHLQEVEDALGGVGKQLGKLTEDINKGKFEGESLEKANALRKTLTEEKNKLTDLLSKAKKDVAAAEAAKK